MDYQPTPIKVESVITKAADEVVRFINVRELEVGATLPPETQLATMLGISRNSLREALRILDSLGFIEKRAGKQAIVRSRLGLVRRLADPAHVLEGLSAAYEARMLIEHRCVELAAGRVGDQELLNLSNLLGAFEGELQRENYEAASRIHGQFHEALVLAAKNPFLSEIYEAISSATRGQTDVLPEALRDRRLRSVHRAIYEAILKRDVLRAGLAVRRHFRANLPRVEFRVHNQEQQGSVHMDSTLLGGVLSRPEAGLGGRPYAEPRK